MRLHDQIPLASGMSRPRLQNSIQYVLRGMDLVDAPCQPGKLMWATIHRSEETTKEESVHEPDYLYLEKQ